MKALNKDEKELLKDLTKHRGFKLLEELVKEFEYNFLLKFKEINLGSPDELQKLNGSQNYLKGANSLMQTIKTNTNQIGIKDKKDFR